MTTLFLLAISASAYSQPEIPVENIPADAPEQIAVYIKALYSQNPSERADAAFKLGELGWYDHEGSLFAVDFLIALLNDKYIIVQRNTAEALGKIRDARAVSPLISAFRFNNEYLQEDILLALVGIGKDAVEPLINELNNADPDIRSWSVYALGKIKDGRAINPVIKLLEDEKTYVRARAATTLGQLGSSKSVIALINALKDAEPEVRINAVSSLGIIGDSYSVTALIEALKDNTIMVRANAAGALGAIKDVMAVEPLIEALKDSNNNVVGKAAGALGEIRDSRALTPLLDALYDKKGNMRLSVVRAIGYIKDRRAIDILAKILEGANGAAKTIAIDALSEIDSSRVVPILIDMLRDKDFNIRWYAIETLSKTKDARAIDPIGAILRYEKSKNIRVAAARALGNMQNPLGIAYLEKTVLDINEDEDVQMTAVEALSKIDSPLAENVLIQASKSDKYYVRLLAEQALFEKKITTTTEISEK